LFIRICLYLGTFSIVDRDGLTGYLWNLSARANGATGAHATAPYAKLVFACLPSGRLAIRGEKLMLNDLARLLTIDPVPDQIKIFLLFVAGIGCSDFCLRVDFIHHAGHHSMIHCP
jgi:hypothetical protein